MFEYENRKSRNWLLTFLLMVFGTGVLSLSLALNVTKEVYAAKTTPLEEKTAVQEENENKDNKVYDELKERMKSTWRQGMEQLQEANPIKVEGNLMERALRSIAAGLYRNLKNIKGGSLIVGLTSFILGTMIALSSRKNKKIRKAAVGILMAGVPALLLFLVFGLTFYIKIFI